MYRPSLIAALFAASLGPWSTASAQTLDQIRTDVRALHQQPLKAEEPENHRPQREKRAPSFLKRKGTLRESISYGFLAVMAAPYWLPRVAIGDDDFSPGYFLNWPYFDYTLDGEARTGFVISDYVGENADSPWLVRTRAEYADDLNSLSRIGGQILLDSAWRWGIDTEFNRHSEDLRQPLGTRRDDELWLGDLNLVYRFAQSERLQMRSGVGLNWLADPADTDFGFNFTYSGDWFPVRPWVISTELDKGKLGAAKTIHGRVTAGVIWQRSEVFVGYDYLEVGNNDVSSLVSGLRFWF